MNIDNVLIHWRYFLSLERDVEELKNYIEISNENYKTYSIELFKVLLLACSEIDSVLRVLCKEVDPDTDYYDETTYSGRIDLYKTTVTKHFPRVHETEVLVPGLNDPIKPWEEWQHINSPAWWKDYNKAKHYRHSSYKSANLKNMLMAMSALMIVILYLYRHVKNEARANPSPLPRFFDCKYISPTLISSPDNELPDFE